MKITSFKRNVCSPDQFETLVEFDDGAIAVYDEKHLLIVDKMGKLIDEAYKAGGSSEHARVLDAFIEGGVGDPEDLNEEDQLLWMKTYANQGWISAISRDNGSVWLKNGELVFKADN